MNEMTFEALQLLPEIQRAIDEMGFEAPTDIQAQAIPLMRTGSDIIGRSQTGTGKTMAFAIPAVEMIDREETSPTVQVLILCPTRELAQQGGDEIRKLTRFMLNIWPVEVYGGAPMDKQIFHLRRANIVIGTPGRVMDHMRRGTLTLEHIKLVVLDEADEMLNMGFREDIETILKDVPEARQTVMFSATMPDAIMELTGQYLKDPQTIEINKAQVTLDTIVQQYMDVPMGRKLDALNLFLRAYQPKRCMIFCNTKLMVDDVSAYLNKNGFTCEGIHGDMNQSQRTRVMEGFKSARLPILVATDVAARGIDVSDIDYVVNYDIPQNSEQYVHRIGRTGRAGKDGNAVSIISGRRQIYAVRDIAREVKSEIKEIQIPTVAEIKAKQRQRNIERLNALITEGVSEEASSAIESLIEAGYDLNGIAAAAYQLAFATDEQSLQDIIVERKTAANGQYRKLMLTIGRRDKVAPNHIVSAIAQRANIRGSEIGKIEIFDERALVGIPAPRADEIARAMQGVVICGHPVKCRLMLDESRDGGKQFPKKQYDKVGSVAIPKRGKIKLSEEAKSRLLDASDLSRFEIHKKKDSAPYKGHSPAYNRDSKRPMNRTHSRKKQG